MKRIISKLLACLLVLGCFLVIKTQDCHCAGLSSVIDNIACDSCGGHNIFLVYDGRNNCDAPGTCSYQCLDCSTDTASYQFRAATPAGHFYELLDTTPATCQSEGSYMYVCGSCKDQQLVTIPKIAHHYVLNSSESTAATCTSTGKNVYYCDNNINGPVAGTTCNDRYEEVTSKLNHSYVETIIKQATCTQEGSAQYKCSLCNDAYTKALAKLPHNNVSEHEDADCENDGFDRDVCSICNEVTNETTIKALGHDIEFEIVKQATCDEEGLKVGTCKRCGKTVEEPIDKLEHSYPKQWTVEKEAGLLTSGTKTKKCSDCGDTISEEIEPKIEPTTAVITAASTGVAAVAAGLYIKKKTASKVAKKIVEEVVEKSSLEPEFEEKTIVVSMDLESNLYKLLKRNKYLVVVESEFDELAEAIEENEPTLTIVDLSLKGAQEYIDSLEEENDIVLLLNTKQLEELKETLDELVENKTIKAYGDVDANAYGNMVKLVLPSMKPDLKSDEALDNIGMVADVLGIPAVSTILGAYVAGRDIKATLDEAEGKVGIFDIGTIVNDIAGVLGLDTIESVSGVIVDIDDIKSSLESKIGANEASTTIDAVSDIVDVAKDIIG